MIPIVIAAIHRLIVSPEIAACGRLLLRCATRLVARELQIPEPLVHDASRYLCARVDLLERRLLAVMFGAWR
jgi:hypothetical protein